MRPRAVTLLLLGLTACSHAPTANSCRPASERRHETAWSLPLDTSPGAVAVDRVGAVVTLPDHGILAVDRSGRESWRADLPGAGLDWPVVDDDLVVVPTSSGARAECVALERASGAMRWRVDAGPGPAATTGIAGDLVVCATAEGRLVAVDRDLGTRRWEVDVAAKVGGDVAISGRSAIALDPVARRVGFVFVTNGAWTLGCLELETGRDPGCSRDLGVGPPPSAVVSDGTGRFVFGWGSGPGVVVLDANSGADRSVIATADAFDPANIPLVVGDLGVVVDRSGQVTAVDLERETLEWHTDLGQPVLDARPTAAGGVVSIVDWTGRVHDLRVADGRRVGATDERGGAIAVISDPAGHLRIRLFRGLGGARVEAEEPSKEGRRSPLQCPAEPGHPTRNDARP